LWHAIHHCLFITRSRNAFDAERFHDRYDKRA